METNRFRRLYKNYDSEYYELTLDDKKKQIQREKLISSQKILGDFRPKTFLRNLNSFLHLLTPEELEVLIVIKNV